MRSCGALLAIGLLASACGEGGGEGTVSNPNLGINGGAGMAAPIAGMAAPTAGTMAPAMAGTGGPTGGMAAPPRAGTGASGTGAGGMGAGGTGTSGTGAGGMAGGGEGGMGASGTGASGMGGTGESSCLDGITDFFSEGPFQYEAAHEGSVKIWVPAVPAGCKVPIVHLANGTGATCSAYQQVLNRLASHGFLTTCYENTNTGAGTQGVMAIETVIASHGEMAMKAIGSTGHSQGGQAAFTVLQQAEEKWGEEYVYAGLAMEPASGFGTQPRIPWQQMYGMIKSPMFMFSGTADVLVSQGWVSSAFRALPDTLEAYHWSAIGATHIPTPQPETAQIAPAWFRWKLLGDNEACKAFKSLPDMGDWRIVEEQNQKECM